MTSAGNFSRETRQSHSKGWLFCVLALLLCLAACDRQPSVTQLSGATMGTTWHVTYIAPPNAPAQNDVQQAIAAQLEFVNRSMSTYLDSSEISRFNTAVPDTWFGVSHEFYSVLSTALVVGRLSEGAYDVTVAPLVELWGFGAGPAIVAPPSRSAVEQLLQRVGQDKLRLDGEALAVMKPIDLSLDFSSLAKGFAVDQVANWLTGQGIERFLVEVGGEMRVSGASARGDPWRVAIEQPESIGRSVAAAISITDVALATSGNYRNFFEVDGQRFSHSIDPRTGYPVAHDLVSVTVVHPSAMLADAWATALTVLGAERAMAVAQAQGLAVYFIRSVGGDFVPSHTPAFAVYLDAEPQ
jgi:thiamine biosynthesis lipoprotein